MIYTNENWKPPVTYCEPNEVEVQRMNKEEAIEILRDTPIDIRSTREDDIHTLYATAQGMAIEALKFAEHFDLLKEFQSLQEVVRCKDCKHRDLFSCPLTENDFQKDEDFCSWGERKGGDTE